MTTNTALSVEEKIKRLPPFLQQEVADFVEFLYQKAHRKKRRRKKLKFKWAGALKEYRDRFTSVQLQKKALQWWK